MPKHPSSTGVAAEHATELDVPFESGSTVRLQLPLHDSFASTLRVVLASLGSDIGFSVDDIDDLRLAVSEVFTTLVQQDGAGGAVDIAIGVATDGRRRTIDVSLVLPGERPLELDELARAIIGAAVEEFHAGPDAVRLVKRVTVTVPGESGV